MRVPITSSQIKPAVARRAYPIDDKPDGISSMLLPLAAITLRLASRIAIDCPCTALQSFPSSLAGGG
jgi:hypothetical protein